MPRELVVLYSDAAGDAVGGAEQVAVDLHDAVRARGAEALLLHHGLPEALLGDRRARRIAPLAPGVAGAVGAARLARELRGLAPRAFWASLSWQGACRYGLLAARLARVPRVAATLQLGVPLERRVAPGAIGRLAAPDLAIAVSTTLAPVVATWFELPPERVHVVENSVRVERLRGAAPVERAALGLPEGPPLVLALARLAPEKGLDVLLDALVAVPDAVLAIAGEGPLHLPLASEVAALGLGGRVRLLGRRDDVPALLAAADVLVLPSRNEGTPLAVLEGMAAGRAVVATAIPGTRDLVEDGVTGLLVPPDDAAALAAALAALCADPARRATLGTAAAAAALARPAHADAVAALLVDPRPHAAAVRRWPAGSARDLDWRFALPDPAPARVAALGRGALPAAARALGTPVGGDADLAVAAGTGRRTIRRAAAALVPGPAALYLEDERRLRPPLAWTRRRLAAAGLDDVRAWWTWPPRSAGGPNLLVPYADARAAAVLAARRPPAAGRRRLAEAGALRLLHAGQRLGVVGPVALVASRGPAQAPARAILLTAGRADVNKVVLLEVGEAAVAVRKVARVPAGEAGLRREADVLARLPADAPAPGLIATERAGPFLVVHETYVPGVPIARLIDAGSFDRRADAVARALRALVHPERPAPWAAARAAALADATTLGLAAEAAPRLPAALELPGAIEHGDAAPWNVLVDRDGTVALADWESAEPDGLPLVDLAYFLTTAALLIEGDLVPGRAARAAAVWRGDDALARALQAIAAREAAAAGIAPAALDALRVAAWLRHAARERERLDGATGLWQAIARHELGADA